MSVGVGENWKYWRGRCRFRFHHSLPDPHQQPLLLILGVPDQPPVLCRIFSCLVILLEDQPALDNTSFYFPFRHSRRFWAGLAREMEFNSMVVC
jgi:hypothetical protein